MQDKQYDPARLNEKSPAEGMAAVNTHNPNEEEYPKTGNQKSKNDTDENNQHENVDEHKKQ